MVQDDTQKPHIAIVLLTLTQRLKSDLFFTSPVGFGGSRSINDCHSHEGGNPTLFERWIPAYAGMTTL